MYTTPVDINMRTSFKTRTTVFILFFAVLVFAFITYRYSILDVQKTTDSWKIVVGSQFTITVKQEKQDIVEDKAFSELFGPKWERTHPVKNVRLLLWSNYYSSDLSRQDIHNRSVNISPGFDEAKHFISYGKPKYRCPLNYTFTVDRNEVDSSDALIVFANEADDLPKNASNLPWILEFVDTPLVLQQLKNQTFMKLFKYSTSYRLDSDFPNPRLREPSLNKPIPFHQKYDYVATVFSNCHQTRTQYTQALSKYYRIWSFGDCLRNVEKNNLARKGDKDYISSKIKLIRLYKFALTFMRNDCTDFIDEQLNHAWEAGTVPVYLGTDTISDLLPEKFRKSFINVGDFKTPEDLASHLEYLVVDPSAYHEYLNWKNDDFGNLGDSPFGKIWRPDYSPGCQIAMKILKDKLSGDIFRRKPLEPLNCDPKSLEEWIGKPQPIIIND